MALEIHAIRLNRHEALVTVKGGEESATLGAFRRDAGKPDYRWLLHIGHGHIDIPSFLIPDEVHAALKDAMKG